MLNLVAVMIVWLSVGAAVAAPVVVENPAAAPLVETWHLHEVWRLGGDVDDPDIPLLGVVSRAAVDTSGNVFLMDTQLGHVLLISPQGEYLGSIGSIGEGPGEVQRPSDVCLLADGTVGLLQSYPAKVVKLTRDGTPAGSVAVDNPALNFFRLRSAPGRLVVAGQRNDYEQKISGKSTTYRFIASLDQTGQLDRVYLDGTMVTQWQPPVSDDRHGYFPWHAWDLQATGILVVAPERDRYHLEFFNPEGDLVRVSDRPFNLRKRTADDKEKIRDNMKMTSNGKELEVKKIVADTDPVFRSLLALHDGTIWVKTCYSEQDLPDGVFMRYDVLNAEGRLLKEVQVVCAARRDEDAFGIMPDGRFIWIRNLTSAYRAMYPGYGQDDDEAADDDDEDVMLEVIILERAGS